MQDLFTEKNRRERNRNVKTNIQERVGCTPRPEEAGVAGGMELGSFAGQGETQPPWALKGGCSPWRASCPHPANAQYFLACSNQIHYLQQTHRFLVLFLGLLGIVLEKKMK